MTLLEECLKLTYKRDSTGVLMAEGYGQWCDIPEMPPTIKEAVDGIALARRLKPIHVMVNRVEPGIKVPVHVDQVRRVKDGPFCQLERWHYAVQTNPLAWLEWQGDRIHLDLNTWGGPYKYWLPHALGNDGTEERIHLVVDLG